MTSPRWTKRFEGAITLILDAVTFSKSYYAVKINLGDAEKTPRKKRQSLRISRHVNSFYS